MKLRQLWLVGALAAVCTTAFADDPVLLRDLDAAGRVTLTKDELTALLPGASMGRISVRGFAQFWKNDPDGTFIISNAAKLGAKANNTTQGKWHISDDGRYCVLIEWRGVDTEEWCRYIIRSADSYYATKSDKVGTEKVFKLDISKK
jgi:hypothetical protein